MRLALAIAVLSACGSAGHTGRTPHADPRWFCRAIDRGDLATASAAASTWLTSTGSAPGAEQGVTVRLHRWLDAQPCVAHVHRDGCARGLAMTPQPKTMWRWSLLGRVHGDGRVEIVDATWDRSGCNDGDPIEID